MLSSAYSVLTSSYSVLPMLYSVSTMLYSVSTMLLLHVSNALLHVSQLLLHIYNALPHVSKQTKSFSTTDERGLLGFFFVGCRTLLRSKLSFFIFRATLDGLFLPDAGV